MIFKNLNILKPLKSSSKKPNIAIIGSGSWATALTKIFTDSQNHVFWYVRDVKKANSIRSKNRNLSYLPEIKFKSKRITVSSNINDVVNSCSWVVLAIPSSFLEKTIKQINIPLKNKFIVSAVKGIIPESKSTLGEHLNKKHEVSWEQFVVITGPSHAEEIALERTSYLTLASIKKSNAGQLRKLINTKYIQTKISNDVIGVEYAGALKNIFALAIGIAHGLSYGDNFQSVLLSNAIREMDAFLKKISKSQRNINDSAYLGDLLVTGYSTFSRNRRFGNLIGRGHTIKGAQLEMSMIAEGYYAVLYIYELSQKYEINTPIIDTVYRILYKQEGPKKNFKKLTKLLD